MDRQQPSDLPRATAEQITDSMIHALVHAFYGKVRSDAELGPIFEKAIGEDWDGHLAKMCDFWSSVMLMSGRYEGNPMLAHRRQKAVRLSHFKRWLELFRQTATEICPPEVAVAFQLRAESIAKSLQLGIFSRSAEARAGKDGSRP